MAKTLLHLPKKSRCGDTLVQFPGVSCLIGVSEDPPGAAGQLGELRHTGGRREERGPGVGGHGQQPQGEGLIQHHHRLPPEPWVNILQNFGRKLD